VELPAVEPFHTLKIFDVPDASPTRFLVEDLWADQACGFIGGRPKGGKSWLALDIGISVAAGVKMFGRFPVDPGRVLHYNAEDKPGRTKERARMLCRAKDINFASLDNFEVIDVPRFWLDDDEQVARLKATVAKLRPKLVILDPLRRMHRRDEDKANEMDPLLDSLRLLQREYACSVMLVHHIKKIEGDANGESLRGSSVFHAWLDSALYVTHKSKDKLWDDPRRVQVEHRDSENIDPFEWRLQKATTVDGESAWLEIQTDEAEQQERRSADENGVISVLQSATEPLAARKIDKEAGKRNGWSKEPLQRLVRAGTVHVVEGGRFPAYRLQS
jgi:hypothetical protein